MSISRKYGRTYHFPFSPGTTSDDRINHQYWDDISTLDTVIHTEKLDGENTCLNKHGIFARSHAAPTRHPWANHLKHLYSLHKNDLGDLEIFGENVYAIHSIEYVNLSHHFYVFAIREKDKWLSWEEVCFYAAMLDFPTVPVLGTTSPKTQSDFESEIQQIVKQSSTFGSVDVANQQPCRMEGIVTRNMSEYSVQDFKKHVFKYVRKDHVKTDEHWTRNWKRATLQWEKHGH